MTRTTDASAEPTSIKGFKEIPTSKGLPRLGITFDITHATKERILFHHFEELHKELGKIYRRRLPGLGNVVFISDPGMAEVVYRSQDAEETYPMRADMTPWVMIRNELGETGGVLTTENEEWKRLRTAFNKKVNRMQEVSQFAPMVNEMVTNLITRIEYIQRQQPSRLTIPNLTNEFYRFAFETASYVLFQRQLGCLEPTIPPETQQYIDSIATMFEEVSKISVFPSFHQRLRTSSYLKALDAGRIVFDTARRLIDDKVDSIRQQVESGKIDEPVDIATYVLMSNQISKEEIYSNVTDILLAGVDTTSNTMVWLVYELAGNQDVQKKLREEIDSVVGGRIATADDVKHMSYLKCCVKEVLRMYPPLTTVSRVLKSDVVIGGYLIPKGTPVAISHWTMSRNNDVFPDANRFLPDRWLRKNNGRKKSTFASMPFGFGIRSCLGRHLAEMKMQLATIRIIQTYNLERDGDRLLTPIEHNVLAPSGEVPVRFCPRKSH